MSTTADATTDRVLLALLTMQRESWEQGITGQALLDLGRLDAATLVADAAVTRQRPDGRLGELAGSVGAVNGAACGEVVRHAAITTGDPRYAAALDAQLDWLTRQAPPGTPTARCSTCSTAARCGPTRSTWWCRCSR
ncbi:hypothetical protein [Micromonospora sp. RP3T]|uniref:hypothetical protein n=1 Tax=Micromonospora sp. RP3T TaxID=2135446 RepID=UPI003D759F0C